MKGKAYPAIQEMNHYINTWNLVKSAYISMRKLVLMLEVSEFMNPSISKTWKSLFPGEEWIPSWWRTFIGYLEPLQSPS